MQENYTLSVWTNDAADMKRDIAIVMSEIQKAALPPLKAKAYALESSNRKIHDVPPSKIANIK